MTIAPGEPQPERPESASLVTPKWTRMRFVRCEACGAKALVAASGCPACGHALGLRDSRGEPVPLAHCPTCDLYYPRKLGECRWCGTEAPTFRPAPYIWSGAGFLLLIGMGWAAWQVRGGGGAPPRAELVQVPSPILVDAARPDSASLHTITRDGPLDTALRDTALRDTTVRVAAFTDTGNRPLPVESRPVVAPAYNGRPGLPPPDTREPSAAPPVTRAPTPAPTPAPADVRVSAVPAAPGTRTVSPPPKADARITSAAPRTASRPPASASRLRWVPATVRRWVNVHSSASPDARIVAALGPDTRVQLGEARAGWQRVRARDISGWVEQKHISGAVRRGR